MKSVMMDGRVWFSFDQIEVQDLVSGLISAQADNEVFLEDNSDFVSISFQMQLKRQNDRYQALIEQFTQGHAY